MFKPPFGLYCPLFRSSSYPAPMTPESRTDFSSNQSKNPFFWPGCFACVARVRRRQSRVPLASSLAPHLATVHDSAPDPLRARARSIAVPSPSFRRSPRRARARRRSIVRSTASTASIASIARARSRARAPRALASRARGRVAFRIKPRARRSTHLARGGLLRRDALRPGRVRGVHDDARGANGKHEERARSACVSDDARARRRSRRAGGRSPGVRDDPCVKHARPATPRPRGATRDPSLHDARELVDMGRVRTKTVKKVRVDARTRRRPATTRGARGAEARWLETGRRWKP